MNPILTYDPGDGRTILREGRGGSLVKLSDYEALEKRLAVVQAELESATETLVKKTMVTVTGLTYPIESFDPQALSPEEKKLSDLLDKRGISVEATD